LIDNYGPKLLKRAVEDLSPEEALQIQYDWSFWARPDQIPPDTAWYIWLLLSGRGGGKTRSGSELVIDWAKQEFSPIALVGQTKADVRDTMIELGDSSIMRCSPPWFMPSYEPTKRRLTWPNGVIGIAYSGDEPGQLRGPQHQKAWVDELAKFERPQETWDNLMFGLRVGRLPQVVVTTTPRPIAIIKQLANDPAAVVVRTHTQDNAANLDSNFLKFILDRYEGTRLGRQELGAEILSDNPQALWKRANLDEMRLSAFPDLARIAVAVDPGVTSTETSAETGIIVAGVSKEEHVKGYVLADYSLRGTPREWASAAVAAYHTHKADVIIGEANNGGDMIESTVKTVDEEVNFKKVIATRGKYTRAEPVSALYEQKRIHHVGFFHDLEDQLCEWVPGEKSPDRLDALVWAFTELMLSNMGGYAFDI